MANILAWQRAEQEGDLKLAVLCRNWIACFLDRHPQVAGKFSTHIDRQRVFANNFITFYDYFNKLQKLLRKHRFLSENVWNMDETGFILRIWKPMIQRLGLTIAKMVGLLISLD